MSAIAPEDVTLDEGREPVLDTVERVSEMCFGLFMALTFVGAVSVVTAGDPDPARTMFATALGCNLAWGLVDAIMYLVRTLTTRGKRLTLALALRQAPDRATTIKVLRAALPSWGRDHVGDDQLAAIGASVAAAPLPVRPRLGGRDYVGAFAIFLIVVATTFPVALPFIMFKELSTALIVSRVLTIAMLFGGGFALGRFAGFSGWPTGLAMTVMGVLLTIAIIALGG
jgi:VIT1/CCC1 family predicted Fe2+/Mn2+ transporter